MSLGISASYVLLILLIILYTLSSTYRRISFPEKKSVTSDLFQVFHATMFHLSGEKVGRQLDTIERIISVKYPGTGFVHRV
jgi:hypothetical protein